MGLEAQEHGVISVSLTRDFEQQDLVVHGDLALLPRTLFRIKLVQAKREWQMTGLLHPEDPEGHIAPWQNFRKINLEWLVDYATWLERNKIDWIRDCCPLTKDAPLDVLADWLEDNERFFEAKFVRDRISKAILKEQ